MKPSGGMPKNVKFVVLCMVLSLVFIAMPNLDGIVPSPPETQRFAEPALENYQEDWENWLMHNDAMKELMKRKQFLKLIPMRRVHERDMPFERFYREHVLPGVPVVVTGLNSFKVPWDIEYLKKCGDHMIVPNVKAQSEGDAWSNLEDLPEMKMTDFLDHFQSYPEPRPYLHDLPLIETCPHLLNTYVVPRYVQNDYLTRAVEEGGGGTNGNRPFDIYWPTLFVGGKNTASGLHVDNSNTHFIIHQIDGLKRVRLLPPEDRVVAGENRPDGKFATSLFDPDFDKHPLLSLVTVYDTTLEKGDFLYIPGGAAHQTHNTDFSISISSNYADDSNVERVTREFEEQQRYDLAENIRERVRSGEFVTRMDVHDIPWPQKFPHLVVDSD